MRCELTCRGIEDACSRVLGSFLIRFYLLQGKFKQSKRILIFIKYDLSSEIFIHFVQFDPINITTNIINIPLNALLQPSPPRKTVQESVGDKMTRAQPRSWKRAGTSRRAHTLLEDGQQRRQSRESRKVAESRGPSGRDPAGMQRRLELIDRGTRANLSASWRRV